jgi:hypothetical protein
VRSKIKNIKFVRFGGLSPVIQEQYITDEDKSYHNPPARKGLYAFPENYIEYFLIGSTSDPDHISGKSEWVKDFKGNKIVVEDADYDFDIETGKLLFNKKIINILKFNNFKISNIRIRYINDKKYLIHVKRPKTFEHKGEIWSHFIDIIKPENIIEIKGSWVKTTYEDYIDAFNKFMHISMKELIKEHCTNNVDIDIAFKLNNPFKNNNNGFPTYCKDDLEVFIEKMK